jgi:hypothetical protein
MPNLNLKKCCRCGRISNNQEKEWDGSDSIKAAISNFNSQSLLTEAIGKIKLEKSFCPDCQPFKECLTGHTSKIK